MYRMYHHPSGPATSATRVCAARTLLSHLIPASCLAAARTAPCAVRAYTRLSRMISRAHTLHSLEACRAIGPNPYKDEATMISIAHRSAQTPSNCRPTDFHPCSCSDFRMALIRVRWRLSSPPLRCQGWVSRARECGGNSHPSPRTHAAWFEVLRLPTHCG